MADGELTVDSKIYFDKESGEAWLRLDVTGFRADDPTEAQDLSIAIMAFLSGRSEEEISEETEVLFSASDALH